MMLPHRNFYRRDTETQRRGEREMGRKGEKILFRWVALRLPFSPSPFLPFSLLLRLGVSAVIAFCFSCSYKATDPRTVLPADPLVYLESRDLARTLGAITNNQKFDAAAKSKPNLAALRGVKVSIAVTGFETSEQSFTEENAVLKFQPRFVAVVETNAWSWQTTSFIEDKLGEFVNDVYAGEVE